MKLFKKSLAVVIFALMTAGLFAFPGIVSLFPTSSGQYVYYRDYTFPEETYIGFLQYDEGTYAIRYYTPVATQGQLPIIEMYLTVNTEVDYVDITGEKIASPITQNDTEVLNYLHDLLYEFGARRKKINDSNFMNTVTSNEDFMQFGGNVSVQWDFFIPIFNLRSITSEDGDILLEAVTCGILSNNNDQSFVSFNGFEDIPIIDDYYKAMVAERTGTSKSNPSITKVTDGLYLVGEDGIYQTSSSSPDYAALSDTEIAEFKEYLRDTAWQILYPEIYNLFAQLNTQYLPFVELTITDTAFYLKAICPANAVSPMANYTIVTDTLANLTFNKALLMIPVDTYWENPAFYESLVK